MFHKSSAYKHTNIHQAPTKSIKTITKVNNKVWSFQSISNLRNWKLKNAYWIISTKNCNKCKILWEIVNIMLLIVQMYFWAKGISVKRSISKAWLLGMVHIWRLWELSNFQDPPLPLSIYVQDSSILQSSSEFFYSSFIFSINSLILSGIPLTSFHLAEASISTFLWLYTLVCAVVQKYQMSFLYNYSHFWYTFCNQPVLSAQLENVNKLWNNNRAVDVNERNQNKNKTKPSHI